jgi:hypothetical protein
MARHEYRGNPRLVKKGHPVSFVYTVSAIEVVQIFSIKTCNDPRIWPAGAFFVNK